MKELSEINQNIPFLWRLSSDNGEGFCAVSMVVAFNSGDESFEHTIETDVLSFASDSFALEEETLEWNEDDISLFLTLVSKRTCAEAATKETVRVDLSDPETIEIVNVVAAAGFGLPQTVDEVLVSNIAQPVFGCEIGSPVSISTAKGYKRCIVVDMDDDEVVCVMLDKIEPLSPFSINEIFPHELLLVKKHHLLHPLFTSSAPTVQDVLH